MPNVMAALPNIGGALCSTGRHLCMGGAVVQWIEHWTLQSIGHGFNNLLEATLRNNLGQVVHTYVPLSPSSITWYRPAKGQWCSAAGEVTAGLVESNGSLPPDGWLTVACALTASTPGSAPGPMLGIEYGKAFTFTCVQCRKVWLMLTTRVPCSNTAKTRNPLKFAGVP